MPDANSDTLRAEAYRLYQAGDQAGAERLCQTLLKSSPNDADAIYLLGAIALGAGRLQEASTLFGRAARLAPDNAMMVNAYGETCFNLGRQDEALACFLRAGAASDLRTCA